MYDLLDSLLIDCLGFREFCALVFLLSSSSDGLLLKCLYDHGPLLFDILGAGQHLITGERLKTLGLRVLSLSPDLIDKVSQAHSISYSTLVDFELFQVFYFHLFKLVDSALTP